MPPDQPTRDRVASDFTRNFLVEAGAGSGKTYSLAMRMAAGVERGAFQVSGMAAVTFTRKAAAELRGRFQEALETRLREAPGETERGRLQDALDHIERLFAGTIHAFCAHLLRERPVDARVAPGFEELGDADNVLLRKQAWRDFVVERRAGGWTPMLDLLDAGVKPRELDEAFAAVCEHEDVVFDEGRGERPHARPVWKEVEAFWARLNELRPPAFHEKTTCEVQRRFDELAGRIRLARRDRPASLADFLRFWPKRKVTQCYWDKEVGIPAGRGREVQRAVDTFAADVAVPFLDEWYAYVHRLAMAVLLDGRAHYGEVRRRRNVVNYVDLLRLTAAMLRERGHVRRALQGKYRWLFIDEFQDTDPIQAEIFLMLAADEGTEGEGPVDPYALPLRPGALFVVGDPKQSIFRFRRADIDIYNRVAARIVETGGERLSLTANFRSLPGVCALANTVFPPLFAGWSAPWSPVFEELDPVRPEGKGDAPRIAKLTLPKPARRREASKPEAEAIAAWIKAEVDDGRRAPADFLILTRFRSRLSHYVEALNAVDIPVEVSGAGFFCKSPEVRALALLLAALGDPLDAVSLVGVLRGPLFGISDPELFGFRQAGGRFELHVPLPESADDRESASLAEKYGPALAAMRRLHALHKITWSLPLGAALDAILEETGWLALAATRPGGAAAGRLLQAVDRVRQVVEAGGGLAGAAEALEEEEESNEADAVPLEPGRRNVVRVMNLHKAKGLEAPVVVLADPTHDYAFPLTLRIERRSGRALGHLSISRKGEGFGEVVVGRPRDWPEHAAAEKKYVDAERLRLLYVAATRAEDQLIVCRVADVKNPAWAEFDTFLAQAPELARPPVAAKLASEAKGAELDVSPKAQMTARRAREAAHAKAREASWAVARVTSDSHADSKSDSDSNPNSAANPNPNRGLEPEGGVGGPLWGTLIHGLLEHAVRHPHSTCADLERLALWLTVESHELRGSIPAALDLVEGVRHAPFWSEVRDAVEAHVEVPFAVRLETGQSLTGGASAGLPTVLRGVIDLTYRAGAGWRILDYKTDREPGDEASVRVRHGAQVRQYGAAWERVSGEAVAGTRIVLVRTGQAVET